MAVIPAGGCFQDRRVPNLFKGTGKVLAGSHCFPWGCPYPVAVDKRFFRNTVLCYSEQIRPLRDRRYIRDFIKGIRIHILKLICQHITAFGKFTDSRPVIIPGNNLEICCLCSGAAGDRVEYSCTESHIARSYCHHAPKLPASYDTDGITSPEALHTAVCDLRQARHLTSPLFP